MADRCLVSQNSSHYVSDRTCKWSWIGFQGWKHNLASNNEPRRGSVRPYDVHSAFADVAGHAFFEPYQVVGFPSK
jgi:hypothetical protein